MGAKSDAYIVEHNGKYLIRPAFVVVRGDEEVLKFKIRNITGAGDAEVKLPRARVATGTAAKKTLEPGDGFEFQLAKVNGNFSYKVKVDGVNAEGESDPVIIIDPDCP